MSQYQFLFCSLATDEIITELPLSNTSFSRELNAAGGFAGECPLSIIEPNSGYELLQAGELDIRRTSIYVLRDNVVVWGGKLFGIQVSLDDDKIAFSAKGFFAHFANVPIDQTLTFAQVEQFDIVQSILTQAQTTGADGIVRNLGITLAKFPSTGSGVLRDRTYFGYERKPVAEAITQLSQVVNGFDFEVVAGGTFGAFTKTLQLWYPAQGHQTDFVWEAGGNLRLLNYQIDGDNFANRVDELGAGDGDLMLIGTANDPALAAIPLQVQTVARKSVKEVDTLNKHAVTALALARAGKETVSVEIINLPDSPFGSYVPGDTVRLRASHGYLQLDRDFRIMRYTVTPDDSGSEIVAVDLAPVEAFFTDDIEDPA